jgi:hypothetical protein
MGGIFVLLPVAVADTKSRSALIETTCKSLQHSLVASKGALPPRVYVRLHLNGSGDASAAESGATGTGIADDALAIARRILNSTMGGHAEVTADPRSGKTRAVNFGLREARRLGCDLLLCVDDDLVVPRLAVSRILEAMATHARAHALTAYKAPLLTSQATPFQRLYSYAFTTSFRHNIYPKRATGSFYGIRVNRIEEFPADCNEGDLLDRVPNAYAGVVVRSPFPKTRDEEVRRRIRLELACRAARFQRLHHDPAFLDDVDRCLILPDVVDKDRYRQALALSRGIVAEAMQRLNDRSRVDGRQ